MGRFINSDLLVSTGQGLLGNNMFAYCRNNPVCRRDISGATDEKCYDDGTNLLHEEKSYEGGKISTGDSGGNGNQQGAGRTSPGGFSGLSNSSSHKIEGNNYAGNSGKTEVHHVVEQCQTGKSGFSKDQIRAQSNTVVLDYNLHRQISGYYSSKPQWLNGLRVRDYLAGQSFEAQTAFGWRVINQFYYGLIK